VTQRPLLAANNTGLSEQSKTAIHNYEIVILYLEEKNYSTFLCSSVANFFCLFSPLCVGV